MTVKTTVWERNYLGVREEIGFVHKTGGRGSEGEIGWMAYFPDGDLVASRVFPSAAYAAAVLRTVHAAAQKRIVSDAVVTPGRLDEDDRDGTAALRKTGTDTLLEARDRLTVAWPISDCSSWYLDRAWARQCVENELARRAWA